MLFSVNCESRKVIIVTRDLPSLIAVNCAHDPPLRPLFIVPFCEKCMNVQIWKKYIYEEMYKYGKRTRQLYKFKKELKKFP